MGGDPSPGISLTRHDSQCCRWSHKSSGKKRKNSESNRKEKFSVALVAHGDKIVDQLKSNTSKLKGKPLVLRNRSSLNPQDDVLSARANTFRHKGKRRPASLPKIEMKEPSW